MRKTHVCIILSLASALGAQTLLDLRSQTKRVDFSAASSTFPIKTGGTLPSTCGVGEMFFNTNAAAGSNLYACTSSNVWTQTGRGSSANVSAGYGLALLNSALTLDPSVAASLYSANTFYNLNDFSHAQIRVQTAGNPPAAAECSGTGNVGKLFARSTVTTNPLYVCAQTGVSTFAWVNVTGGSGGSSAASSPLGAKGDLWGFSSTDVRIPVGADGQVLMADSSQSTGLRWASASGSGASTSVMRFPLGWWKPGDANYPAPGVYGYSLNNGACTASSCNGGFAGFGNPSIASAVFGPGGADTLVVAGSIPSTTWSGSIKVRGRMAEGEGGSGTVIWSVAAGCSTSGGSTTISFTSSSTITASVATTWVYFSLASLPVTGCSAGDTLYIRLTRTGGTYNYNVVVPDLTVEI